MSLLNEASKEATNETIEKLKIIRDLLTATVAADNHEGFGEFTKYVPAFNSHNREVLEKKAMKLIEKL